MKIAKDIMTRNPKFVQSGDELSSTVTLFLDSGIHFSPVITLLGEVLGLLSEIGLIRASLRNYLDPDKHEKVYAHKDLLEEAGFVNEDTEMEEIVKVMLNTPSRRVLVKNKEGKFTGIISPKDVLSLLNGTQAKVRDLRAELIAFKEKTFVLQRKIIEATSSKEKFQKIFEDSPYMIHGVDANGYIVLANKKIHERLGYAPQELLGKKINELYPSTMLPMAVDGLKKIIAEGSHVTTYTTMLTKLGDKLRADIASSSLKNNDGSFLSTISISREIDSEALLRALHGAFRDKPGMDD
jgi:PAS domain S-box-containing protein